MKAQSILQKFRWSGNIRQLRNVEQISVLETNRDITAAIYNLIYRLKAAIYLL
jgi:DNA-binding NtrC family response regulator